MADATVVRGILGLGGLACGQLRRRRPWPQRMVAAFPAEAGLPAVDFTRGPALTRGWHNAVAAPEKRFGAAGRSAIVPTPSGSPQYRG